LLMFSAKSFASRCLRKGLFQTSNETMMNKFHSSQVASALLMIRPVKFCYNQETALDNTFMRDQSFDIEDTQAKAFHEFNNYVSILKSKGIKVACFDDTHEPHKPDSVFPNNWISFHEDGTIVLYPMKAKNRRVERRMDIIEELQRSYNFKISNKIDMTEEEERETFLEGTGSIIFDYINRIAYACISQRTSKELLEKMAAKLNYEVHAFTSVDENGKEIYHSNVMMCLGERFAMVCADSIPNKAEREELIYSLEATGHEIVFLTYEQISNFAGNALEVRNEEGKTFLIVSKRGYESLTEDQKAIIEQYSEIVPVPLDTIETNGGGSARCMIADIRLPINL